jgi:hypothetical protein
MVRMGGKSDWFKNVSSGSLSNSSAESVGSTTRLFGQWGFFFVLHTSYRSMLKM